MSERTAYEVIMTNGEQTYLVGHTQRKSRVGLRNLILGTSVGKRIAEFLSDTDEITFGVHAITFLDWTIKFSGYTEKDGGHSVPPAVPAIKAA
jgi:hypothetical protein